MTAKPPRMKTVSQPAMLRTGDRMDAATFHALYLNTPEKFKAELIEGVVHVSSPVSAQHGLHQFDLAGWLYFYSHSTLGVIGYVDTTHLFDGENQPQPDLGLAIRSDAGGQSTLDESGYVRGAPELVVEVAVSSADIDLGAKRRIYESAGVREYIVAVAHEREVHWFTQSKSGFRPLKPGADGSMRSKVFPGLWLDPAAVFVPGSPDLLKCLQLGIASPEHAKFCKKLSKRRRAES